MDILISAAILKSLNAPFFFSSISDLSWETTLACTERDLDAKRSCGLLALYSYLQQSLIRVAQNPPVRRNVLLPKAYSPQCSRSTKHYARSYFPTIFWRVFCTKRVYAIPGVVEKPNKLVEPSLSSPKWSSWTEALKSLRPGLLSLSTPSYLLQLKPASNGNTCFLCTPRLLIDIQGRACISVQLTHQAALSGA